MNIAAFTPAVFGSAKPRNIETWHCTAMLDIAELTKRDYFGRESYLYARAQFLVQGALPAPSTAAVTGAISWESLSCESP